MLWADNVSFRYAPGAPLVVDGVTHRAGAELTSPAGSSHTFAAAEGPDLLYLGIIQGGMNIDGNHISPSNPTY